MARFTMKTLADFAKAEAEIRALPSTEDAEPGPSLNDEYAARAAEQAEFEAACVNPGYLVLTTCSGLEQVCQTHATSLLVTLRKQKHIANDDDRERCPDGCGRSWFLCWTPIEIGGRKL